MTHTIIDPETDPIAWLTIDNSASPAAPCGIVIEFRPDSDPMHLTVGHTHQASSGWTFDHAHRHIIRWDLPATVDARALTAAINAGDITPLLERIRDGYDTRWDGSNMIATYTNDADAAISVLDVFFDDVPELTGEMAGFWAARDWFGGELPDGLTADTTDEELAAVVEDMEAAAQNAYIPDIAEYLHDERERLQWRRDDGN